jgi:predicted RNA binding protein YcfA (HicA-like mRNA interferase family)
MSGFYRDLVAVLREHGFQFARPAKGSHEVWHNPATKRSVTVPGSTKSRHTANEVLKQAGIEKKF